MVLNRQNNRLTRRQRNTNIQVNQTDRKLAALTQKVDKMSIAPKTTRAVKKTVTKQAQTKARTQRKVQGIQTFPKKFNFRAIPRGPGLTLNAFAGAAQKHPVPTAFSTGRSTYHNLLKTFNITVGGESQIGTSDWPAGQLQRMDRSNNILIVHPFNNIAAVRQCENPPTTNPYTGVAQGAHENKNIMPPQLFTYLTGRDSVSTGHPYVDTPREFMPQRMSVQISNITEPTDVSGMVYVLKAPLINGFNTSESSFSFMRDYNRTTPFEAVQLLTPRRWNCTVSDQANYMDFSPFSECDFATYDHNGNSLSDGTSGAYPAAQLQKLAGWAASATALHTGSVEPSGMGCLVFLFDSPKKAQNYNITVKYSVKCRYPMDHKMSQMEVMHPTASAEAINAMRDAEEFAGTTGTAVSMEAGKLWTAA
jgi:hypothetical protein